MHPQADIGRQNGMSFDALLGKVRQAEAALEAQERQTAADWRQCKASWRAGWTPARIVIAGLVSGFLVGKAEPLRRAARGGGALQLIGAVSGLFAGGNAQAAADQATQAADSAQRNAAAAAAGTANATAAPPAQAPSAPMTPDLLRQAGLI